MNALSQRRTKQFLSRVILDAERRSPIESKVCIPPLHGNDVVAYAALPHPSGLNTRSVAAGYFASIAAGLVGRGAKLPPQFGQRPFNRVSTQSRQKVHSNVQIIASGA